MPANKYETLKKATREMTIKDMQKVCGDGPTYKLNLGCGSNVRRDYVNIDCIDMPGILQLDLEIGRLPFPKGSVTEIIASHIMEHLHNYLKLLNECHRVLKPGGSLYFRAPCYPSVECFQDPTHVQFFTERTLNYFLQGHPLYEECGKSYGIRGWKRITQQRQNGWELVAKLDK